MCVCVCVCVLEADNESKDSQESLVHKTLGSAGTAIQLSSLSRQATWAGEGKGSATAPGTGYSSAPAPTVWKERNNCNKWGGGEQESQTAADTYIALIRVEDLLVATEKHIAYAA